MFNRHGHEKIPFTRCTVRVFAPTRFIHLLTPSSLHSWTGRCLGIVFGGGVSDKRKSVSFQAAVVIIFQEHQIRFYLISTHLTSKIRVEFFGIPGRVCEP
jgi:hypothetical protein